MPFEVCYFAVRGMSKEVTVKRLTSRPYATPEDLGAMIKLLIEARPTQQIAEFPSIEDLREFMGVESFRTNTRIWEDACGQLIGFAIRDGSHLMFEFMPHQDEVVAQIVAWAESGARRTSQIQLVCGCSDFDSKQIALLKSYGFVATANRSLSMVRSLSEPIVPERRLGVCALGLSPEVQVPQGFIIRHLKGETEVEALVALHRAAFGTQNMTVEYRLAMMSVPDYDPELDLIAVTRDGTFAAYCMCHISYEENRLTGHDRGFTDPVATHPAFQRLGLAKALLLRGLTLLHQHGVETACLGTAGHNHPMQRTAAAAGFRIESERIQFAKPLA